MKKKTLILLAFTMFITLSCSKNKAVPNEESSDACLVSEVQVTVGSINTLGGWSNNINFTHNEKGNLLIIRYDGADKITSNYTHTTASITQNSYSAGHNDTQIYLLDPQGRINNQGKRSFKYDSEGYLIEEKDDKTTIKYTWTNGNLTKIGDNIKLEYSTESRPTNFVDIFALELKTDVRAEDGVLVRYFGKQSKNLISKVTESHVLYGGIVESTNDTFTYLKDDKDNVTKMTKKDDNGREAVYTYKYTCK